MDLLQTQTSAISQCEPSQTSASNLTLNVDDSKPSELGQETVPSSVETGQVSVTDHDSHSQTVAEPCSSISSKVDKKSKRKRPKDGSIIGSHVFTHDRVSLAHSLESVLNFWMATRQPAGVGIENVNRCGWCEFEEGCEWRWVLYSPCFGEILSLNAFLFTGTRRPKKRQQKTEHQ